jgi:hypothetical protein
MDESERLVALAALAPPERAVAAWNTWRTTTRIEDASGLLTWAGGYIHRNLLAAGIDDSYLAGIHRYNLISNNRKVIAALPTVRELSASTTVSALKSFGMSSETYSRGLRPLADIDFFVPFAEVDRAREVLADRGFRPNLGVSDVEFATRVVPHRGSWNYLDDAGADLDLHWRIFEHLETTENARLVEEYSRPTHTEFGSVRRLGDELMLLSLVVHHLHSTGPANGLFDAAHLIRLVDTEEAARLARRIGIEREVHEVCVAIREIVGDDAHPRVVDLERRVARPARAQPAYSATRRALPVLESIPQRFREDSRLRHPVAYRFWTILGRPLWLERLLLRRPGTLVRPIPDPQPYDPEVPIFPRTAGVLGTGWHHLYPDDRHRWASLPDARVTFPDVDPAVRTLRLELDPEQWAAAPRSTFDVHVNGRRVGTVDKSAAVAEFAVRRPERMIEVSLRARGLHRFRNPGSQQKWYRMLAPVRAIDLR